jgi:hypothetical protein
MGVRRSRSQAEMMRVKLSTWVKRWVRTWVSMIVGLMRRYDSTAEERWRVRVSGWFVAV